MKQNTPNFVWDVKFIHVVFITPAAKGVAHRYPCATTTQAWQEREMYFDRSSPSGCPKRLKPGHPWAGIWINSPGAVLRYPKVMPTPRHHPENLLRTTDHVKWPTRQRRPLRTKKPSKFFQLFGCASAQGMWAKILNLAKPLLHSSPLTTKAPERGLKNAFFSPFDVDSRLATRDSGPRAAGAAKKNRAYGKLPKIFYTKKPSILVWHTSLTTNTLK